MATYKPIDLKYIEYCYKTKQKSVPATDPASGLPIWLNNDTGEQVVSASNPAPGAIGSSGINKYSPVMTYKDISFVEISIPAEGIPEGTKKVHVSYMYIPSTPVKPEPDAETSFDVPENATYPISFSFAVPAGTTSVEIEAQAETEEVTSVTEEPVVSQNFVTNPTSASYTTNNAFGIAVTGSATPTESDFVTYGE